MAKIITLRLTDEEYEKILSAADTEGRSISDFITKIVLKYIEGSYFVDEIERAQIVSDRDLVLRIREGHREARKMKGRFIE